MNQVRLSDLGFPVYCDAGVPLKRRITRPSMKKWTYNYNQNYNINYNPQINRNYVYTGIEVVDPVQYEHTYGSQLVAYDNLPPILRGINSPVGERLARYGPVNDLPDLYGDVWALTLIDLKSHGLQPYEHQIKKWNKLPKYSKRKVRKIIY